MAEQTCYCGNPILIDGPSDLYCTPACQTRWLQKGHDYLPIPARPEWRMGASESEWRRSMAWPDVPALPPQDVGQWIEDTDPAPVEAPPKVERIDLRQVMKDLESPTTQVVAVDGGFRLVRRVGVIQRIRNATRRNT